MTGLIAFFTSPLGRWVVIGLAFLAWTAYQRDQAADRARQECQAEQLQKTVDELQRQRDAARQALAEAEARQQQTEAEMKELEDARDRIVEELENAGDSCRVPDGTIERLRNIR